MQLHNIPIFRPSPPTTILFLNYKRCFHASVKDKRSLCIFFLVYFLSLPTLLCVDTIFLPSSLRSTCWLLKALWETSSRSPSSSLSATRPPTWPSSSSCCWPRSTSPAPTCTCRDPRPLSWSGWFSHGCLVRANEKCHFSLGAVVVIYWW